MERVTRLVEQRPHVLVHVDRVHEDQRHLAYWQRVAVTSGRVSLPVVEVQQARLRHAFEVAAEVTLNMAEDFAGAGDELAVRLVPLEGSPAPRRAHCFPPPR